MRMIDAYWEKRNLGIDVQEVICAANDSDEELKDILLRLTVPYSVVKIPANCISLLMAAGQMGYSLIETSIHYEGKVKNIVPPSLYERFNRFVSVETADEQMMEKVLKEIESGNIFTTDRIALDPFFSKKIAGVRYSNWCKDEIEAGADMEIAYYKGVPAAFNVSKEKKGRPGAYVGLIGGVFTEFIENGLGFLLVQCEVETCKKNGGQWCLGTTSSNNLPSLRLHLHYGFDVSSLEYVLIKHQ